MLRGLPKGGSLHIWFHLRNVCAYHNAQLSYKKVTHLHVYAILHGTKFNICFKLCLRCTVITKLLSYVSYG